MRDPLIPPLAAVVAGILIGRLLGFSIGESAWPVLAFLALAALARGQGSRWLMGTCVLLAILFVGVFAEAWHRPGPPPQIDAGSREIVLLEGCVVEPTVFSPDREQFTLELDRGARARVSLSLRDGDSPQRLDYGQRVEIEGRVRRPHNYNNPGSFDYAAYLARQKSSGPSAWSLAQRRACCRAPADRARWAWYSLCVSPRSIASRAYTAATITPPA